MVNIFIIYKVSVHDPNDLGFRSFHLFHLVALCCKFVWKSLEKSGNFFSVWTLESGNTDSGCATGEAANTPLAVLTTVFALSLERFHVCKMEILFSI